ncbi:UNVERIFIED_CONTAM: hypothetical protein NCL1_63340 [Trichonephila clavipes]
MLPVDGRHLEHDETVEERKKRLAAMAQCSQERRGEETEEQRSRRLAAMAKRDQERRAEETEEQRSHRLSTMARDSPCNAGPCS